MTGSAAVAFTLKPGEISGPIDAGNTGVVLWLQTARPRLIRNTRRRKIRFMTAYCNSSRAKFSTCSLGIFAIDAKGRQDQINEKEMAT